MRKKNRKISSYDVDDDDDDDIILPPTTGPCM